MSTSFERLWRIHAEVGEAFSHTVEFIDKALDEVAEVLAMAEKHFSEPEDTAGPVDKEPTTEEKREYILNHPLIQTDVKAYDLWLVNTDAHTIDVGYSILKKFGDK